MKVKLINFKIINRINYYSIYIGYYIVGNIWLQIFLVRILFGSVLFLARVISALCGVEVISFEAALLDLTIGGNCLGAPKIEEIDDNGALINNNVLDSRVKGGNEDTEIRGSFWNIICGKISSWYNWLFFASLKEPVLQNVNSEERLLENNRSNSKIWSIISDRIGSIYKWVFCMIFSDIPAVSRSDVELYSSRLRLVLQEWFYSDYDVEHALKLFFLSSDEDFWEGYLKIELIDDLSSFSKRYEALKAQCLLIKGMPFVTSNDYLYINYLLEKLYKLTPCEENYRKLIFLESKVEGIFDAYFVVASVPNVDTFWFIAGEMPETMLTPKKYKYLLNRLDLVIRVDMNSFGRILTKEQFLWLSFLYDRTVELRQDLLKRPSERFLNANRLMWLGSKYQWLKVVIAEESGKIPPSIGVYTLPEIIDPVDESLLKVKKRIL